MSNSPIELVLSKLPDAKPDGNGWKVCCPAHEDRSPSLSVNQGDDGRVLLNCFAGCSHDAIVGAMGLQVSDLFVPKPSRNGTHQTNGTAKSVSSPMGTRFATAGEAVSSLTTKLGRAAGQWTYHDASGKPVALVLRFNKPDGSKEFRPASPHDDGGWYAKAPATPRPLYGLPDMATASVVYVCEGEKAVDAVRSIGLIATTSMNGSQSPDKSDWTPLVGKTVVILPDNDEAGRKYADAVADILHRLDSSTKVKIVELPGLPPKGDVVEWIEAHGDAAEPETMRQELERLIDESDAVEAEPDVPPIKSLEYMPFPVDELPKIVRDYVVEGAKAVGVDPAFIALPVLAMLAACIGNTRRLFIKGVWTEPPIVWTVIVGNSGACKSPALELALKPLKDRQRDAFKAHTEETHIFGVSLLTHERAVDLWKRNKPVEHPPEKPVEPIAERFVADDTTIESLASLLLNQPRGLLVARDELAGWLGSFDKYSSGKGGDVPKWLEMFGGRSITIDRKTGFPRTLYIPRAAVCLTGGIQPETLKRYLGQDHFDNGLVARLLFAYPPARPRRWTDAEVDKDTEAKFRGVVEQLLGLQFERDESAPTWSPFDGNDKPAAPPKPDKPKMVDLSADAKELFIAFVNEQGAEHVELSDRLSAAWSKLEGYAARLALILHLVKAASGESPEAAVDAASMASGIALSRWFGHEAKRIYGMLSESEGDSEQRKLIEWITRKGRSVTAREVQQGHRQFRTADDAETVLTELVTAGFGRWEPSPAGQRGQPTRRFTLLSTSTVFENPS